MAERRMFAKTIIDSDAFLDMPLSTQALYFHLSMRADDDGFVNNPKKIQRMIGCSDDDLKLLIAKRFVLIFDSGVIVIKHWRLHNTLRKDRYKPTIYQEEFKKLILKSDGGYTDRLPSGCQVVAKRLPSGCQADDKEETTKNVDSNEINELDVGCQSGNQVATQDRLGKDRLINKTNLQQTEVCNEGSAEEEVVCSEDSDPIFDEPLSEQLNQLAIQQTNKVVDDPNAIIDPVQAIGIARTHGIKLPRTIDLENVCKRKILTVDNMRQCIRLAKRQGNSKGIYVIGIMKNAVNEPSQYHTEEYKTSQRVTLDDVDPNYVFGSEK